MRRKKLISHLIIGILIFSVSTSTFAGGAVDTDESTDSTMAVSDYSGSGTEVYYTTIADYEAVTGKSIPSFSESPLMAEMVAKGEIPPLEKRLPDEPLVLAPAYEIGKYGGNLQFIIGARHYLFEMPVTYSSNMYEDGVTEDDIIHPNVFTSWKVSDDAREWTFTLRKGIKWSDGVPFSLDDFEFLSKYILPYREFRSAGIGPFLNDNEYGHAKFTRIDDSTMKYTFSGPYATFLSDLAFFRNNPGYACAHYLKDFHKDTADADELAAKVKEEGFSTWIELFSKELTPWANPGSPVIYPWYTIDKPGESLQRFARNPYYWKIDPEGNQLPYADGLEYRLYTGSERDEGGGTEVKLMKVMAGEVDFAHNWNIGNLESLPILLQQEESSGLFDIRTPDYMNPTNVGGFANGEACVNFNYDYDGKDDVKEALMNDVRFRRAISLSINRDEVNELVYNNMYKPSPSLMKWGGAHPGNNPNFFKYGAYDVKQANALLDEIGLAWNSDKSVRLLPDGRELELVTTLQSYASIDKIYTLYKDYFSEIGIHLLEDKSTGEILGELENDLSIGNMFLGGDIPNLIGKVGAFNIGGSRANFGADWALWMDTNGAQGNEPPDPIKRVRELSTLYRAENDSQKRWAYEEEILQIYVDNAYYVGGLVEPGRYHVYSTRIGNVPQYKGLMVYIDAPSTWYVK